MVMFMVMVMVRMVVEQGNMLSTPSALRELKQTVMPGTDLHYPETYDLRLVLRKKITDLGISLIVTLSANSGVGMRHARKLFP